MSIIALSLTATLLNFILMGTNKSGAKKSYETVMEAADAAVDISSQLVSNRGVLTIGTLNINNAVCDCNSDTDATDNVPDTCFCNKICDSKLTTAGATNWPQCTADPVTGTNYYTSLDIDPSIANTYDMTFQLGTGNNQYNTYLKVVDTIQGNSSSSSSNLRGSGTVASNSGMTIAPSNPYIYRIEILAQRTNNPLERARITMLYAY